MHYIRALLFLSSFLLCASAATAQVMNRPSSLLVYPVVDNSPGTLHLLTITNTNLGRGSIRVEFIFVEGSTCARSTTAYTLTPGDTLTINTRFAAPNVVVGYAYAYATTVGGSPVSFNHLAGASFATSASGSAYEAHPYAFRAIPAEGQLTNVDLDQVRDLNNVEYEPCPDQIVIPRFLAEDGVRSVPRIAMINLSYGTSDWTAVVDFQVYNDNEDSFYAQRGFICYLLSRATNVSSFFLNNFLQATNHSQVEPQGLGLETGWYKAAGFVSQSNQVLVNNPAILVAHFDTGTLGGLHRSSPLPYGIGTQDNGDLGFVPQSGDTN